MAELARAMVLRDRSNAFLHVLPTQMERLSIASDAPQRNMDMRVFGIVMGHGNPLQRTVQVPLHSAHKVAGESGQIDAVAEFRRDDQLPEALVSCGLPPGELSGNFNSLPGGIEACQAPVIFTRRGLALDIPAVGAPLARRRVARVCDPNRTTLKMRTRCSRASGASRP
jgi:hypothetical protein